jgi:acyl carrier protein
MTIRTAVLDQMHAIARQQNKVLQPLTDAVPLLESGLDSLCIAILVANLDDELGIDPFGAGDEVAIPETVGDLVRLYEAAAINP